MIEIIPAIDLIDGKCVRLSQGDYAQKTVYNENPLEVAKMFADAGYAYHKYAGPSNSLSNTLLYTYGAGIDLVSVYDFVFRVEYSRNQLGREGLYLQGEFNF